MKILFLCNSIGRQGTFFRWHNLAIGLTQLGHEVTVWAFDHAKFKEPARVEEVDGVTYRLLCGNRGRSWFTIEHHPLTALRGCFRDHKGFDVVHVFQPFLTSTLPWLLRRKSLGKAIVYDWDDLWENGFISGNGGGFGIRWGKWITAQLERHSPRRADHVTTCSDYLAELARARGAIKTTVIGNGFWPTQYPSKAEARKQLGLRDNCLYAGFMGRTITKTELGWLAATARLAAQGSIPCRLAICGMPESILTPHLGTARQSVDYLGQLTPEQCRVFAATLDLGLLPLEDALLNHARFPIKFSDYLAAGVPILMTKIGPCAQASVNWPWVFQAEATQASWEEKFSETIANLNGSQPLKVDAKVVEQICSWLNFAKQAEAVYLGLLT